MNGRQFGMKSFDEDDLTDTLIRWKLVLDYLAEGKMDDLLAEHAMRSCVSRCYGGYSFAPRA